MPARAAPLGMNDEYASLKAATEAYWASPSVTLVEWSGSPQSWPPTKVTPERTMRQAAIDVLDDKTKLKMAVQYATSAYYGSTVKGAKSMSAAKVRDATINIFGLKAAPTRGHISKLVKQQSVGTEPRSAGRPKHVTADVTQGVADYCTMLRAWKLLVFHSTVISHFQRLIDGTDLQLKFKKDIGDGLLDWNLHALDNWYKRRFLGDHPEISSGLQRPLDVARERWGTSDNLGVFYNRTRDQLLEHGIARLNPDYVPFYPTSEANLALSEVEFKKAAMAAPPEIIIIPSEAWRLVSFDELCLKLSTHDEGGSGTSRNCEKNLKIGDGDVGEVLSSMSSCRLSGLGGSHANYDAMPGYFSMSCSSVDVTGWTHNRPTADVCGMQFTSKFL